MVGQYAKWGAALGDVRVLRDGEAAFSIAETVRVN